MLARTKVDGRKRPSVTWQGRRRAKSDALTCDKKHLAAEPAKHHYKDCNVAGSFIWLEVVYLVAMAPLAVDGLGISIHHVRLGRRG